MRIPLDHPKHFEIFECVCDILPFVEDRADEKARFTQEMCRNMHFYGRWDITKYCDTFSWQEMWDENLLRDC